MENTLNLYLLDKQILALNPCSRPAEKIAGGEHLQDKLQNYHQRALGSVQDGDGSHGFIVTYGSNPLRQRVLVSGIICLFLKLSFMCLNFKDLCQSVQMLVECSLIFVNLLENT